MNRVLITGANGLVGSATTRRFVEAGYQVSALCRAGSDLSLLEDIFYKISIIEGDVLDIFSLEKALENQDFVVHTAALVSFAPKDRNQMFKVNVEGTANVVNICLEKKVKKLCYISSIAALGRPTSASEKIYGGVIDEKQKWEDSPLNSNYAKSKFEGELEVWRGEAEGLAVLVVNPSIILGEGDWHKSSTQLFKYVYDENKYYTNGNFNYVDVKDVVEAIFQLTSSNIQGERFILNGGTLTYREFFNKIAANFGKKAPSKTLSPFAIELLWRIEAIRAFITKKAPLITKETAHNSRTKFAYKNEKIQKAINFSFTPIDETISRVVNFLQKEKLHKG
ncbi:NAD-dependent epimerase/dehydratase [Emticicia oligotrophica DSM 17448]|uniref:NAD-dependent epimerase/dehydratase n=1 Tax=Emticicia oligotrophica (strain DSM 17448 / CIP 109782 / MTCC 6937 / GPTSA100-15) TaxID=929562 RepID=A0ABM5N0B9_EMTOG|nr:MULTISPECIES: NAD-dependent epimerase/dehydratase family protein [Emticicia]AFK02844.1 NAD-dependent epimerase/dehydratase [Emticicia oligotrophica DSM 17448]